ncbi:hypothetical protein Tdes44962_MAKER07093 [Teratosphaeria destructans]|uniref:Uncharacterized protein n=1 Tax=Teratosphaeria destructans TaxID=418781 RepID=A0A9W7T0D4_9PEZI|nr:hypothetical protein Tdes44962_MAKER07093 [Teratosphaeria destructans]
MPILGISTAAVALSGRLSKLHGAYVRLGARYRKLTTNTKRNLLGPFPEERFYVAAILQWEPAENWFILPSELENCSDIELVVTRKSGGLNEICPVWLDFFNDLREIKHLLKEIAPTPLNSSIRRIDILLDGAESKADWVEEMLSKISARPAPPQPKEQHRVSHQYGYGGWNEMCMQVKGGPLHVADVVCGHSGVMAPTDVLTATIKLFNHTAGIQSCTCGYDFSPVRPSLLGVGERTATRRWFMVKPSMLPFNSSTQSDNLPSCVGWLFTPYNHHGQEDPLRLYPYTPDMPASMTDIVKRKRILKADLPDISREQWDAFVRSQARYLTTASMMRAKVMSLSFSRQEKLARDSDTVMAVSVAASPTKSEKRMRTPDIFRKRDTIPGLLRGMPGWTPVMDGPTFQERERRPHNDFNRAHARTKPQSGRPTPQPSVRKASRRERDGQRSRTRDAQSRDRNGSKAFTQARSDPTRSSLSYSWQGMRIPADPVGRYNVYQHIWSALKPEDTGIPYPGSADLTPTSFDAEVTQLRKTKYPQTPEAHLAGIHIQTFFLSGHSISFHIIPDISSRFKLKIRLHETDSHKVKALRKYLRRVESPRWHSDQINKRTGRAGVLDEAIGREERVVVAYTACRDLLRVCEEYTREMGWSM